MKILVTGATGQIGSELVPALVALHGSENVIALGHRRKPDSMLAAACFESLDIRDRDAITGVVARHQPGLIFHLAAVLSAVAENDPQRAWDINMNGLVNVLEVARQFQSAVFFPSSIGAFGPETPRENTPQDTIQRPNTLYGISKVSGELLCDYYVRRYGMDVRGLRFPGLISYQTLPGGGTTDYAVEIFHAAVQKGGYECFLHADSRLDMMYMPDAIDAIIRLMRAPAKKLMHHNAFNVTAMSFTPDQLASAIRRHIPEFNMTYRIDPVRQAIADSWPAHMDDSAARSEWGWRPSYDMDTMVEDMLQHVR